MDIHVSEVSDVIPRTGTAEGKADEQGQRKGSTGTGLY